MAFTPEDPGDVPCGILGAGVVVVLVVLVDVMLRMAKSAAAWCEGPLVSQKDS